MMLLRLADCGVERADEPGPGRGGVAVGSSEMSEEAIVALEGKF